MSAIKATPTSVLLREYFNYTLMTSAATGSLIIAYSATTGEWPKFSTAVAVSGGLSALPALALAARSWGKMWLLSETPIVRQRIVSGGAQPIERSVNGMTTFFKTVRLAFDPTLRNDPDISSTVMKWKEAPPPMKHWDVEITRRSNLMTVITVRLYQDLVEEIILKAHRAQEGIWPVRQVHSHPLSQRYLCSLHYRTIDRKLWSEEYLAFVALGEQYQIVTGRGQGTSGRLAGGPRFCYRKLGLFPYSEQPLQLLPDEPPIVKLH